MVMKVALIILLAGIYLSGFAQNKKRVISLNKVKTTETKISAPTNDPVDSNSFNIQKTATDRYLNGPERASRNDTTRSSNSAANSNSFVGGIRAGNNANAGFDSIQINKNSANTTTNNTTILGGNDTTFNTNTISQGGVTTNSGAVDRSGQAQFGQTNWGNSRGTIGESQWTIPPPITASFNKEFPQPNNATWTRNNVDTTIYSARYKSGAQWITSNYNTSGERLDIRTEFPLLQPPRAVSVYLSKQPASFEAATIYKVQVEGKPDVYEIRTKNARTIYVNNDGMEVNY